MSTVNCQTNFTGYMVACENQNFTSIEVNKTSACSANPFATSKIMRPSVQISTRLKCFEFDCVTQKIIVNNQSVCQNPMVFLNFLI